MVPRLARILRPGGEFRFVTDVADYAAWTLQRLLRSAEFEWTAQCADDWRKPWPGFTPYALPRQGGARGTRVVFSDFSQDLSMIFEATDRRAFSGSCSTRLLAGTCQKRTTRCAVDADSRP